MIIPLSDELRIRGTETAYQLERPHKRKGQIAWEPFQYYSKFGSALAAACEREIRTHPANTLADSISAADAIVARYGRLLDCALDDIAQRSEPSDRAVP